MHKYLTLLLDYLTFNNRFYISTFSRCFRSFTEFLMPSYCIIWCNGLCSVLGWTGFRPGDVLRLLSGQSVQSVHIPVGWRVCICVCTRTLYSLECCHLQVPCPSTPSLCRFYVVFTFFLKVSCHLVTSLSACNLKQGHCSLVPRGLTDFLRREYCKYPGFTSR
jgi:hypothetical protein